MSAAHLTGSRRAARAATAVLLGLLAGCATPYVYVSDGSTPRAPADDGTLEMDDGYRLPLRAWLPGSEPRALVLAVHGLNDYSLAFDNAGRHLSAAGIAVFAYDQRGFGASEGWAYWHGAQRMSRDLIEAADRLRRRYPEPPFYILGESMGGAVVLASLAHRLPENDGIVLVAPAVWPRAAMPFWQRWGLSLLSHTLPGKRLTGEGLELRPTDNIDMLRAWARDPLVIKATRVDVLHGVTNLMDQADAAADRLAGRVLLLYGAHDDIVPRPAVCRFLKTLPDKAATGLTVAVYPDGHHMLMRDLHADRVLDDIVAWMENPVDFSPPEGDSFCDRPGR